MVCCTASAAGEGTTTRSRTPARPRAGWACLSTSGPNCNRNPCGPGAWCRLHRTGESCLRRRGWPCRAGENPGRQHRACCQRPRSRRLRHPRQSSHSRRCHQSHSRHFAHPHRRSSCRPTHWRRQVHSLHHCRPCHRFRQRHQLRQWRTKKHRERPHTSRCRHSSDSHSRRPFPLSDSRKLRRRCKSRGKRPGQTCIRSADRCPGRRQNTCQRDPAGYKTRRCRRTRSRNTCHPRRTQRRKRLRWSKSCRSFALQLPLLSHAWPRQLPGTSVPAAATVQVPS